MNKPLLRNADLHSLLNGLLLDALPPGAKIELIKLDPGADPEEQIAKLIAEHDAEHRKTCQDCAAAYAKEQAAQATQKMAEAQPPVDNAHVAPGAELFGATEIASNPKQLAPRERIVVGYMVFHGERPMPESFDGNKQIVYRGVELFIKDCARFFGKAFTTEVTQALSVRPVYAD